MKPTVPPRAPHLAACCIAPALVLAVAAGCAEDPVTPGPGGAPIARDSGTGAPASPVLTVDAGAAGGGGLAPAYDAGTSVSNPPQNPNAQVCQQLTIEGGRITPDMLIVLDRSTSMQGQGVDRWTPSVGGLKAITSELDSVIRFGLMAFPGRGMSTGILGGGMSCAPGTLEVPIGIGAAPAIATSLDGLTLVQSTPTASTLEAAHAVVGSGRAVLDGVTAAKYVILVTDGAPNCSNPNGGFGGGGGGNDQAAVMASVAAIAAMQQDGVKTYVLGYDTQSDPTLKAALDQMAAAGGTGDSMHRAIDDQASLVDEFKRITGAAASCDYSLAMAPSDPNFVLVQLDGQKLDLNGPDGFSLSGDRKRLTVLGAACVKLQAQNEQHTLSIRVACERQTLL